jgi:hypothetical protein
MVNWPKANKKYILTVSSPFPTLNSSKIVAFVVWHSSHRVRLMGQEIVGSNLAGVCVRFSKFYNCKQILFANLTNIK